MSLLKNLNALIVGFGLSSIALAGSSAADKELGQRLKEAQADGHLLLEGTAKPQIAALASNGYIQVGEKQLNLSEGLHKLLNAIIDRAYADNTTFKILSLAADRGPHGGDGEPVTRAIDLSMLSNYTLRIDRYSGVQLALLDMLDMLPAGEKFNIGLPRTAYQVGETERTCSGVKQDGNACDKAKYKTRVDAAVFTAPQSYDYFIAAKYNETWPVRTANKTATADLAFIKYAPYKTKLIEATEAAVTRGVKFSGWFADGLDHLHIGVDSHKNALP